MTYLDVYRRPLKIFKDRPKQRPEYNCYGEVVANVDEWEEGIDNIDKRTTQQREDNSD
jgi:hypothetical protein